MSKSRRHEQQLAAALDRLYVELNGWMNTFMEHEDWPRVDSQRLVRLRGEFHGAVRPLFEAARNGTGNSHLIERLGEINGLTFVMELDASPDGHGDQPVVFDDDELQIPSVPPLDRLTNTVSRLPELMSQKDLVMPDECQGACEQVLETAAGIAGSVQRLRDALPYDASQDPGLVLEADDVDGDEPVALEPAERRQLLKFKKTIDPHDEYIGESSALLLMFQRIEALNRSADRPVFLLGPTGVGKTTVAELIHKASPRSSRPFHAEQATDAMNSDEGIVRERWVGRGARSSVAGDGKPLKGLLQVCHGGTVFVDELHEAPPWFQIFLLGVLDRREIPLVHGHGKTVKPNVRLIFASNVPRRELEHKLRRDLLRRIMQCAVHVPPLKDRKDDLLLFLKRWGEGRKPEPAFLLALFRYHWPGNIGELKEALSQAVEACTNATDTLKVEHLKLLELTAIRAVRNLSAEQAERQLLVELIDLFGQQGYAFRNRQRPLQKRIGEVLGWPASRVSRKLREHGLDPRRG